MYFLRFTDDSRQNIVVSGSYSLSQYFQVKENFFKICQFIKAKVCHGYVSINYIFTTKFKRESGIENLTKSHINNLTINAYT